MPSMKVSAYSAPDAIIEPKAHQLEKEGHDSLDNFIRQAIGKEPILSFTRSGESPMQWIQLFHALDHHGNGRGAQSDNLAEDQDSQQEHFNDFSTFVSKANGLKKTANSTKDYGVRAEVLKNSSEHFQALKIPDAVVAFARAAAKSNGKPEKYLTGRPLLSPSKVQLQKCDKCSREFCSPINYRRHIRVHRRSLNVDKVSPKNMELLGTFWDKLSLENAKKLASLEDVNIEGVPGSSIVGALTSLLQNPESSSLPEVYPKAGAILLKPGSSSLPEVYLKAGAILLDVVQGSSSRFPISSQKLFSTLDDASEKTFLCAGTAVSLQRFLFDGEVGKIVMDMKNLVACVCFLLEQKLVKAWIADKDAEALRCQKLLFDEEEAAQKRQAELLERRKMKKLRQKEQKTKQLTDVNKTGVKDALFDPAEGSSCSIEAESLMEPSDVGLKTCESATSSSDYSSDPTHSLNPYLVTDETCCRGAGDADQNWNYQDQHESTQRLPTFPHWKIMKPTRNRSSGFGSQVVVAKPVAVKKHNGYRDLKTSSINNQKIWTRKHKLENEEGDENCKEREKQMRDISDGIVRCEVLIGSISVALKDHDGLHENLISVGQKNVQEDTVIFDSTLNSVNEPMELRKQMDIDEIGVSGSVHSGIKEAVIDGCHIKAAGQILQDQTYLDNGGVGDSRSEMTANSLMSPASTDLSGPKLFSSKVAAAFLSQRWRNAMLADHVKFILSPVTAARPMDDVNVCEESQTEAKMQPMDSSGRSILGSTENQIAGMGSTGLSSMVAYKPKLRAQTENGYRLEYIP